VQRGNADIMIRHSARLRGMTWPTRRRARSFRRGSLPPRSGSGRGGRSNVKAGRGSSVAGARAPALAARLTPPSSVGDLSSVAASDAAQCVDGAAGCDVDSDADTVQQATSPLEPMQVDKEAEVSSPSSSVQMVSDSPRGDTYDGKYADSEVDADDALAEPAAVSGHGRQLQHGPAVSAVHNGNNVNTDLSVGLSVSSGKVELNVLAATAMNPVNTAVCGAVSGESVTGGAQDMSETMQRRRPYGTGVLSGVMTTLARWSGVSGMSLSLTGMRGDRESGVSEDSRETAKDSGFLRTSHKGL
jgi:hypothetical protein